MVRCVALLLTLLALALLCVSAEGRHHDETPPAPGVDGDARRLQTLATKMLCNCGCGEVLAECSHKECTTKVGLRQEIAAKLQQGETDEQILDDMGARHGAAILLTPTFKGFNTLLWIVPIVLSLVGVGVMVYLHKRS